MSSHKNRAAVRSSAPECGNSRHRSLRHALHRAPPWRLCGYFALLKPSDIHTEPVILRITMLLHQSLVRLYTSERTVNYPSRPPTEVGNSCAVLSIYTAPVCAKYRKML